MEKKISFSEDIKEIYHGACSCSGSHHVCCKHKGGYASSAECE